MDDHHLSNITNLEKKPINKKLLENCYSPRISQIFIWRKFICKTNHEIETGNCYKFENINKSKNLNYKNENSYNKKNDNNHNTIVRTKFVTK
jgi:hypothetical protein